MAASVVEPPWEPPINPTRAPSTKGSERTWASAAQASRARRAGETSTRPGEASVQTPSGRPRVVNESGITTT